MSNPGCSITIGGGILGCIGFVVANLSSQSPGFGMMICMALGLLLVIKRWVAISHRIKSIKYTTLLLTGLLSLSLAPPLQIATAQSVPDDWPSFQWNVDHTGNNTNESILKPPFTQLWSSSFDTSGVTSMIDVGNTLYIKYSSGALFAVDDQTGNPLWQAQTNYGASVAYANGVIYAVSFCSSCATWRVNGYDAQSGALIMQTTTLPGDIVTLTVANNVIYAGTADTPTFGVSYHTLTAFDATAGNILWQKTTDDAVISYPIVENGIIYFGTYQGSMYAINASDGSTVWQHGGIFVKSSPILQNGILYVGSGNEGPGGPFFALNASDGSTVWTNYGLTFGFYTSPAYANGVVYAQSSGNLGAFDATTGQLLWTQPIGFQGGNIAIANGILYVESNSASSPIAMYALAPTTGQILWQLLGSSSFRSPLIANHTLYFGSDSGTIYAFQNSKPASPTIQPIAVSPAGPVLPGTTITASAQFTYPNPTDTIQGNWRWGDGSQSSATIAASSGSGSVTDTHAYSAPGVYTITLALTDTSNGAISNANYQYVAVYDSGSSFAGGKSFTSPSGAIPSNPSLSGKVSFGINAKYTNTNTITGTVKMDFKIAGLSFTSTSLAFLVTSGGKAVLEGTGVLNGNPNYTFLASGIDGTKTTGPDLIRFQIKDPTGTIVYDSQPGAGDLANPNIPLDTGNIRVN